jgi:RNA polymerase sigma-70 factor (ECF subfamily)
MPQLPDTRYSLLARLADPADAVAWSEFMQIYRDAIYRYSRSRGLQDSDALDVVQNVLVITHQAIGDWQPSGQSGAFRNWLVQTAHRVCLRALRNKGRSDHAVGGSDGMHRLQLATHDDNARNAEDADWQRWAFCWAAGQIQSEVAPVTWNAFWLSAVEGCTPEETAEKTGLRVGSVYTAKCRVIAKIRDRIQELSRRER